MSLQPATAQPLATLIVPTPDGIASRVIRKTPGGSLTIFAFAAGQGLTEHTSPYEAIVQVLDGRFRLTIGGVPVDAVAGSIVLMPADVPHAVDAIDSGRMLLTMLK